jgi:methionyl-tRNA formyltransferase
MSYAVILIDNNRSRAYVQNFIRYGYAPSEAIVLGVEGNMPVSNNETTEIVPGLDICFDRNESVYATLRSNNITYIALPTVNSNDKIVVDAVANLSAENVIYSGPGGVILREEILSQNKRLFHSHPGIVPRYKGSTTFYYSMLLRKMIGCSVMVMSPGLDAGDVVYTAEYIVPKMPIDYDMVVDPLIRAQTFLSLMQSVSGNLQNVVPVPQTGESNMFYIIHPLLKHMAILNEEEGDCKQ